MRSLNARVTLGAGLVLAVFIALSALALERAFRDSARSAMQERLLAQVYLLMSAAEVDAQGHLTMGNSPSEPKLELPGSGLYAAVTDGEGHIVWRSHSAVSVDAPVASGLPAGTQGFEEATGQKGGEFFLESYGVSWSTAGGSYPFTFSIAEVFEPYQQQLSIYRRSLWGWLGAMAVLLLAAQWVILRWGLRPLRKVADELTRLERGQQEQIAGRYPTEVRRLTENLNTLLTHERAQQKRYRDALADLAHSLKTPLAVVRAAMHEAKPDAELARSLDEQVERMDRIVGYHLQRTAASGRSGMVIAQPVLPAVERMLVAIGKVYADKRVETEVRIDPSIRFRGDEGDLMELLGNVMDNAFKWANGRIRLTASLHDSRLDLTVEDDGPGIPEADAQRVLQRGARADESVPGHGIGLAVTREIVEAYGGQVLIARSDFGGAAMTLQLPGLV